MAPQLEVGCIVGVSGKKGGFLVRRIEDDVVHVYGPHPKFSGAIKKAPASRVFPAERLTKVRVSAADATKAIERRD